MLPRPDHAPSGRQATVGSAGRGSTRRHDPADNDNSASPKSVAHFENLVI